MKINNKSSYYWLAGLLLGAAGLYGSVAQAAQCQYTVANEWNTGFTGTITITNNTTTTINGWTVGWQYTANKMTSSYNATVTGSNPYSATGLNWNSTIQPGQSASFGFQGDKNNTSAAEKPTVTGAVCSATTPTSVAASSKPASTPASIAASSKPASVAASSKPAASIPASIAASSKPASVAASSKPASTAAGGERCNWYGQVVNLCATTASGWGYENNASCVARATCVAQPAPYGVVGGTTSTPASVPASSKPASSKSASLAASSKPASVAASSKPASSSLKSSSSVASISGCDGYSTRYWDCCKPHCGWTGNVPIGVSPLPSCSNTNAPIASPDTKSSCDSGGSAHMCWGLTPFTVSSTLAYGYAATSNGDVCGRCYQLQFTGKSHESGTDPGSIALAGKTMIVQATNIGGDVAGGQFDILVPGGGVGAFNACSAQWGISSAELGAQYGGLLAACKQELGYNASLAAYKSCLTNRCTSVFGSRGLTELQNGCQWYADWFEAADNPALKYKEVACPSELTSRSGINRSGLNDIKNTCN